MMKMKRWEFALLLAVLMSLVQCVMPIYGQKQLSDKIIRLHILANSDSESDQKLKIQVRDAVLEAAKENGKDFGDEGYNEKDIDDEFLEKIRIAAQNEVLKRGSHQIVQVERTNMYFETRNYDTFSLPAGYYDAVRVTLGKASGHNWWCVMLPPLCEPVSVAELEKTAEKSGINDEEVNYITKNGTKYQVKFKIAEIIGKISHAIQGD